MCLKTIFHVCKNYIMTKKVCIVLMCVKIIFDFSCISIVQFFIIILHGIKINMRNALLEKSTTM
jgi:hypothetical protein